MHKFFCAFSAFPLVFGFGNMFINMSFNNFRHKAIDRPPNGGNLLEDIKTILLLLKSAFQPFGLPLIRRTRASNFF